MENVKKLLEEIMIKKNELVKNAKNPKEFESKKMFSAKQYQEWICLNAKESGIMETLLALGYTLNDVINLKEETEVK